MKVTGLGKDGFGPGSCTDKLAIRICGQAEPEQILAPIVVRKLVAGKRFLFVDLGQTEPRGFEGPVRLLEVRWRKNE